MKSNEIDCFDISEGKIIYTQSNVKKPINKQHLMECLTKYFEKNPNIPTDDVVQFILENRPTNVKESIRHRNYIIWLVKYRWIRICVLVVACILVE